MDFPHSVFIIVAGARFWQEPGVDQPNPAFANRITTAESNDGR
jgi:hypothetical protein